MALIPDSQRKDAQDARGAQLDSEVMQRLRAGLGGILAVIVAVSIAHVIMTRALQNEETAVPQAAPTVEPSATQAARDPLSDAGVVPDLPEKAEDEPVPEGPVLPETGEGVPVE
ncbi:hypothetical protein [Alteriqipengyuania sp. 357]